MPMSKSPGPSKIPKRCVLMSPKSFASVKRSLMLIDDDDLSLSLLDLMSDFLDFVFPPKVRVMVRVNNYRMANGIPPRVKSAPPPNR